MIMSSSIYRRYKMSEANPSDYYYYSADSSSIDSAAAYFDKEKFYAFLESLKE